MKKVKIITRLAFVLLVGVFLLVLLTYWINIRIRENNSDQLYFLEGIDKLSKVEYIVVPGAQIWTNSISIPLEDRLQCAYELYSHQVGKKIILSGGYDNEVQKYEADSMKKYLLNLGVNEEDILLDYYGEDTYSTVQRVKEFVGDQSVIICTQRMYAYRTTYLMKKLGLNGIIVSSDYHVYNVGIRGVLREYLATVKAFLEANCKIKWTRSITEYHFIQGENAL